MMFQCYKCRAKIYFYTSAKLSFLFFFIVGRFINFIIYIVLLELLWSFFATIVPNGSSRKRKAKKSQYRAVGSKFAKYLSRLCTMRAWLPTYFDQKFMKYGTVYLPLQFVRGNSECI